MDRIEIASLYQQVLEVIAQEMGHYPPYIQASAGMGATFGEMGLDSLEMLDFIWHLEKRFNLSLDDFKGRSPAGLTVNDVLEAVVSRQSRIIR